MKSLKNVKLDMENVKDDDRNKRESIIGGTNLKIRKGRRRYPALGHFAFSNFFKLLFAETCKNKNNGLKE